MKKKSKCISRPNFSSQTNCLTDDEFEYLMNEVQQLNVSQINILLKKFSLVVHGNKTDRLKPLLSKFQLCRYEKKLIGIYNDINNLFSEKEQLPKNQLKIVTLYDTAFKSPPNITICQKDRPLILGPIEVPIGISYGEFNFTFIHSENDPNKLINISFLFSNGLIHQFEFDAILNGFQLNISIDDPFPQPLDITDLLNTNTDKNTLNIKLIQTAKPLVICVCEYEYLGIEKMIEKVVGHSININEEEVIVASNSCQHKDSFSLISFMSKSMSTGRFECPVCGQIIDPLNVTIIKEYQINDEKES